MARRITELDTREQLQFTLEPTDLGVAARNGKTFSFKLSELADYYPPTTREQLQVDKTNNTADLDKPISTAMQEALDQKSDTSHTHVITDVEGLREELDRRNVYFVDSEW